MCVWEVFYMYSLVPSMSNLCLDSTSGEFSIP